MRTSETGTAIKSTASADSISDKENFTVTFNKGATKAFSIFLGKVAIVQKEKLLARKAAVSLRTDGVLCPSASISDSEIGSKLV